MFTVCRRFSIVSLGWLVLVFADAVVAAQDGIAAAAGKFDVHVIVSEMIALMTQSFLRHFNKSVDLPYEETQKTCRDCRPGIL